MSEPMIREETLAVLPDGAVDYIKRRLSEAAGLALVFTGGLLLAALVTFNAADPSLNHATAAAPANLLGLPGSYFADVMISGFGAAAALPILGLLVWGWKVMSKSWPGRGWLLLAVLLVAMLAAAVTLAAVPAGSWPHSAGPGGLVGTILLTELARASGLSPALFATLAGFVALLAAAFGLGISRGDVGAIGTGAKSAAIGLGTATRRASQLVATRFASVFRPSSDRHAPRAAAARACLREDQVTLAGADPATPDAAIVAPKPPRVRQGRKVAQESQGRLPFAAEDYGLLPPLDLLHPPVPTQGSDALSRSSLEENARLLATVLEDFGVRGEIVKVRPGPVITLYELEPAPGTKSSRVIGLADDIARSMSAVSARVAVVPGRNVIGIELPNLRREGVGLRELVASEAFERTGGRLTLALGKDIGGAPVLVDLARMPHLLIAGTTGSGKSVAINAMILSLLYQHTTETCKLILIDPKMLELSVYDGIPHLLSPVVTEPAKAVVALKWTVREMEERYRAMSHLGVRSIAGYNARIAEARRKGEQLKRRVQTGFDEDSQP
ncbi:MAG: DNA translocase FtsK 4TM domain-containing protein, partial [Rhodospirillales bacterium]